jgi:hypothetical protein
MQILSESKVGFIVDLSGKNSIFCKSICIQDDFFILSNVIIENQINPSVKEEKELDSYMGYVSFTYSTTVVHSHISVSFGIKLENYIVPRALFIEAKDSKDIPEWVNKSEEIALKEANTLQLQFNEKVMKENTIILKRAKINI